MGLFLHPLLCAAGPRAQKARLLLKLGFWGSLGLALSLRGVLRRPSLEAL